MRTTVSTTATAVLWTLAAGLAGGCQPTRTAMSQRLVARMALIDFSGLGPARPIGGVGVTAAVPRTWQLTPAQTGGMFTHVQWRSPTHSTAVGVARVRMPLPLSAKAVIWLAKTQYNNARAEKPGASSDADPKHRVPGGPGRLLKQWTDPVGREWVELENDRYHVKGYVFTSGFDAWVVYSGYRRTGVPNTVDLDLAGRSLESVVPAPLAAAK